MNKKVMDKKELVHQFRTEGILDAAMRVISRRGLEKATMEQVAGEAGISKATIYLYFKNKEDLYFQCVIDRLDGVTQKMKAASSAIDDPVKRLEAIITAQMKAIEADRDFFKVFLTERLGLFLDQNTEFGQEFAKRHNEYATLVSGVLKEGMDRGLIREMDPVRCFYLLFAMVRGMAMFMILCDDKARLSSEAGLILDVFFNGLKLKK
jgi:AcrR family transcriptional regulator